MTSAAGAEDRPWSATLYVGPSTTKYFGAVFSSGRMQPTGVMAGLALDRRLWYLGADISFAAEGQVTQNFFGHKDTTFAFGIGLEAIEPFGIKRTSVSIFTGPSYALDPPSTSIGYGGKIWPSAREKFLNFVAFEFAAELPGSKTWDGVFRFYHRSGVFGLYSENNDNGLTFGVGVRHRF